MRNLWAMAFLLLGACGGGSDATGVLSTPLAGADGGTVMVGTPCVLANEADRLFDGFAFQEVEVETVPVQTSGAAVCLGYHFQGLTACPYGQSVDGGTPRGKGCETTTGKPVTGAVPPQCVNRPAATTVTWSCRCANVNGQTDDGPAYCNCPMSTTCAQVVSSVGPSESQLAGAYCVPTSAVATAGTCTAQCDPTSHPCP